MSLLPEYPKTLRCFFCLDLVYYVHHTIRPVYAHTHSLDNYRAFPDYPPVVSQLLYDKVQDPTGRSSPDPPIEAPTLNTRINRDWNYADVYYTTECPGALGMCDGIWNGYSVPGITPLLTWLDDMPELARQYVREQHPQLWAYYLWLDNVAKSSGLY